METISFTLCHYGTAIHANSPVVARIPQRFTKKRVPSISAERNDLFVTDLRTALRLEHSLQKAYKKDDWKFMREFESELRRYDRGYRHNFKSFLDYAEAMGYDKKKFTFPKASPEDKIINATGKLTAHKEHPVNLDDDALFIGEWTWWAEDRWHSRRIPHYLFSLVVLAGVLFGASVFASTGVLIAAGMTGSLALMRVTDLYSSLADRRALTSFHDVAESLIPDDDKAFIKLLKDPATTDHDVFTYAVDSFKEDIYNRESETLRDEIAEKLFTVGIAREEAEREAAQAAVEAPYYAELLQESPRDSRIEQLEAQRLVLLELESQLPKK